MNNRAESEPDALEAEVDALKHLLHQMRGREHDLAELKRIIESQKRKK